MERMWQQCLFKYLRCEPEEHHIMLTEPPLNTPENRCVGDAIVVDACVDVFLGAVRANAVDAYCDTAARFKVSGWATTAVKGHTAPVSLCLLA